VTRTVFQAIGLARPGTRVVAREWIREQVPPGVTILREAYTPDLPGAEYDDEGLGGTRFLAALPVEEIRRPEIDLVLVSSGAFQRFFVPLSQLAPEDRRIRERYRAIFETFPLVARFPPGRTRLGPELRLYRVIPETVPWQTRRRFSAGKLFVPDGGMRGGGQDGVRFTGEGQWVMAKGFLEAGTYRLGMRGVSTGPGRVTVRRLGAGDRDRVRLEGSAATLRLPERDKYLVYVSLPPGSRILELELDRLSGPGAGPS
jgi:hypothetical protein